MNRPYIICHLFSSLDGKISGPFMRNPASATGLSAYGRLASQFACEATIYGTTTMLDFCPGILDPETLADVVRDNPLLSDLNPKNADDYVAPTQQTSYIVSLDRIGQLEYPGSTMTRRGTTSHIIAVLTRQVSPDYLAYLQQMGISYVFAGESTIDCAALAEKLTVLFGIKRALVAGGGRIDWSFLEANCLDELSLVVAPVIDATPQAATVFERMHHFDSEALALSLSSIEDLGEGTLWLRYHA